MWCDGTWCDGRLWGESELRQGYANGYAIGICCFSTKHLTLRSKSKDRLVRFQNNVSGWNDWFTRGLLFQ